MKIHFFSRKNSYLKFVIWFQWLSQYQSLMFFGLVFVVLKIFLVACIWIYKAWGPFCFRLIQINFVDEVIFLYFQTYRFHVDVFSRLWLDWCCSISDISPPYLRSIRSGRAHFHSRWCHKEPSVHRRSRGFSLSSHGSSWFVSSQIL